MFECECPDERSPAVSVAYSPDASLIAVGLAGGGVSVVKPSEEDITTLQIEKQLEAFQGAGPAAVGATCVRFSPTGTILSAGGGNGGVKAWGTAESDWEPTGSADNMVRRRLASHEFSRRRNFPMKGNPEPSFLLA